jgi:hypothetical protein
MFSLDLLEHGFLPLLFVSFFIYLILRLILSGKVIGLFDPLNTGLILSATAMSGVVNYAFNLGDVSDSFFKIFALYILFFIGAGLSGSLKDVNIPTLRLKKSEQIILVLVIQLVFAFDIALNYSQAISELISGNLIYKTMQEEAPIGYGFLRYLAIMLQGLFICIFYTSNITIIKTLIKWTAIIPILGVLLSGSKSSIFQLVIYFFFYIFTLEVRYRQLENSEYKFNCPYYKKQILKYKLQFFSILSFVAILLPSWLIFVKLGDDVNSVSNVFINRIFLGYDSIIWVLGNNVNISLDYNLSLWDFWFYTWIKNLYMTPPYHGVGELIKYLSTNDMIFSTTGASPNSILILELLFTNGFLFALILSMILGFIVFKIRNIMLMKSRVGLYGLGAFYLFIFGPGLIFGPLAIFQDGSFFIDLSIKLFLFLSIVKIFFIFLNKKYFKSLSDYL